MKFNLLLVLAILTLTISNKDNENNGVIIAKSQTFYNLIEQSPFLLLFFSDNQCQHCQQCSEAYALMSETYKGDVKYAKIYLSSKTKAIFQQFNITSFPTIIPFQAGKRLKTGFDCLGSGNKIYKQMYKWLQRLLTNLKQWKGQEDHSHQLIVHCQTQEQKAMWESIELDQLWLDMYCGDKELLGTNLTVVAQYGKHIQAWQYQSLDHEELSQKVRKLIQAYKYKFILNWNTAIAQQIFINKQSAFVMLINNQSLSQRVYSYYEEIKQKFYQKTDKYNKPILFAVSDLSQATYQTIRLKRYFTAISPHSKRQYYYPLLAFIDSSSKTTKYVLDHSIPKTKSNIEQWIESVYKHLVQKQPYLQAQQELVPWLSQDLSDKSKNETISVLNEQTKGQKYIKRQSEWSELLSSNFTEPFFVYFTWRFDYNLQKLQHEVINWLQEAIEEPSLQNIKFYIHKLSNVDIPQHQGLVVDYVPSLCYIDQNKKVSMLNGVTDLKKIQQFIKDRIMLQLK